MEGQAPFNKSGATHVPQLYVLPLSDRPDPVLCPSNAALPIIDLSCLHHPRFRSTVVDQIRSACLTTGSFQVLNHGIPLPTTEEMSNGQYKIVIHRVTVNYMKKRFSIASLQHQNGTSKTASR